MNKEEPKVLTRMRLSCCWGDNLNEKELNEVVDYINSLQQENKQLKDNWNKLKEYVKETRIKEFEKAFGKRNAKTFKQAEIIAFNMVIDKIQELEKSDSNE